MKKRLMASLASLLLVSGAALAADPSSEIRESTDPDKAAAVEQRARDIAAAQQMNGDTSGASSTQGSSASGKHHRRHHGKMMKNRNQPAKTQDGAATESK
ncbi:hypothetical protein [Noviherbaspirillum galbum]|uniref:Uncharacterized protein n=1 Tax=Noviherbaspirillum galbum TaxID=2709383 RepID=A0A6B3SFL5_9BURK|nr:hypothetical protein [Noviherbaspirillum galbum]NEX59687.1 hypothetical protein [Noviherbaspirillum galbum]